MAQRHIHNTSIAYTLLDDLTIETNSITDAIVTLCGLTISHAESEQDYINVLYAVSALGEKLQNSITLNTKEIREALNNMQEEKTQQKT